MGNRASKSNKIKFENLPENKEKTNSKGSQTINTKLESGVNSPSKIAQMKQKLIYFQKVIENQLMKIMILN